MCGDDGGDGGGSDDGIYVLHVDDDPGILDVTAAFLERRDDLRVLTAGDAAEGLSMLGAERVDCIVSDYDMPGRDGFAFHEAVRDRGVDCPFILYTGHEDIARAVPDGIDDALLKDAGTEQYEALARRIRETVERDGTRVATGAGIEAVDAGPGRDR